MDVLDPPRAASLAIDARRALSSGSGRATPLRRDAALRVAVRRAARREALAPVFRLRNREVRPDFPCASNCCSGPAKEHGP